MTAMPALIRAAWAVNIRQPATILFGFVMPIVIILIFNLIGGTLLGSGSPNQLVAGILAYSVANAALSASAMTFTAWRINGLLSRLRLEPVSAFEVIASRFVVAALVTLLQAAVFIALGVTFLGMKVDMHFLLMAGPLILLAALGFFTIGGIIGTFAGSEQSVAAGLNLVLLPVAFLSGCFIPTEALPQVLQTVMQYTPLSALASALIDAGSAPLTVPEMLRTFIVLGGTAVLGGSLFALIYKRRISQ